MPQLLQQRLRFLQIARVEPLRKPLVNRNHQFARLLRLAPVRARGGREQRLRNRDRENSAAGEPWVAQACSRAKSRSRVLGSMAVATMLTMAQVKM